MTTVTVHTTGALLTAEQWTDHADYLERKQSHCTNIERRCRDLADLAALLGVPTGAVLETRTDDR